MATRRSIAYNMTKMVVLLTLVMGLVLGMVQVVWDYYQRLDTLYKRVGEVVNSIEKAATKAVYTFDDELAAEIAAGLFEFQPINSVIIKDENQKIMTTLVRYKGPLPYRKLSGYFFKERYFFERPLWFQGTTNNIIGTLIIEFSPHETVATFLNRSLTILGGALLQSFLLSILLLFVFYQTVTKPLHRLAHDFKQIDPAQPSISSLTLPSSLANTEFAEVTEAGNKLLRVIGSYLRSKDIAEAQLITQKEETERYLSIAEAIILKLDKHGCIEMMNQRGLNLLGYDPVDIIGRDWFDIAIPPEDHRRVRRAYTRLLNTAGQEKGNNSAYFENEIITKNGDRRLIFWHNAVERDQFGQIEGILSSGQDITARKNAEEALRASEGSLRAIIEATSEGFVIADLDRSQIIDVNTALYTMLGYKREDLFKYPLTRFIHPDDHHKWETRRERARHIPHQSYEMRLLTKSGEAISVEVNASALPKAPNENQHSVAFVTDITERKQQEAHQKELETQLRQAQKMETIGTLAGGIAHDFNNILTPILGYSSLLTSRIPEDDPNHARIQQIAKSANRAANMVKQILTFSRRAEGEMASTDIAEVVKEAMELVHSTIPSHIEINADIPDHCAPVIADSTQIQQMILNLCTNAQHAMDGEGGVLDVRLEETMVTPKMAELSPPLHVGRYLKLTVRDTGAGMDEDTLTRVYDPFFTTKKGGEGTGLGLSMVHGIVQKHQGDIQVRSRVGQGTVFTVFLPVTDIQPEPETPDLNRPQGHHERILIVDDERINTEFLEELLDETGYQHQSFTDSIEALDDFVSYPDKYQMILTDQTMPRMTGDQLVKAVREISPDIPIIMMSGYDTKINMDNAHEFGVDYFIQKPVSIEELTQVMNQLLETEGREEKTLT